jgi:hypothetical protein
MKPAIIFILALSPATWASSSPAYQDLITRLLIPNCPPAPLLCIVPLPRPLT